MLRYGGRRHDLCGRFDDQYIAGASRSGFYNLTINLSNGATVTFQLKPLPATGVEAALEKAKHYRLLNEPMQAESICLDILEVEPTNKDAIITLILALTDQFDRRLAARYSQCKDLITRLSDPYTHNYYAGIVAERRAIAHMKQNTPGSPHIAYDWFLEAMERYEKAARDRPARDDSAILRWNTCARIINEHPNVRPEPDQPYVPQIEG